MIYVAEALLGSAAGIIKPVMAAIGLGLVGQRPFSGRLGRNHRYDSFGNAGTAALIGVLGHFVTKQATFLAAAALCIPTTAALMTIRRKQIDYARARSAREWEKPHEAVQLRELARNRPRLVFVASLVLFPLANRSMIPLATKRLGQQHQHESELFTAGLVIVPQVVSALIAGWIARRAEDRGRKPLLIAGFGVLPARAVLSARAMVSRSNPNPRRLDRGGDRNHLATHRLRCYAPQRAVQSGARCSGYCDGCWCRRQHPCRKIRHTNFRLYNRLSTARIDRWRRPGNHLFFTTRNHAAEVSLTANDDDAPSG